MLVLHSIPGARRLSPIAAVGRHWPPVVCRLTVAYAELEFFARRRLVLGVARRLMLMMLWICVCNMECALLSCKCAAQEQLRCAAPSAHVAATQSHRCAARCAPRAAAASTPRVCDPFTPQCCG